MRFQNIRKKYQIQSKIKEFKKHSNDCGSSIVQIAKFTYLIEDLTSHLKEHPKDFHSLTGLKKMSSRRKKLLNYLKTNNMEDYKLITQKLNI